ncbi:MAG: hypothetical protein COB09_17140 [Thalassobium sp.]|nr:MAG: hypothetical protein COB09_17140 [Thalassobium sp.]
MAANRYLNPRPQYFDSSGNVVADGKLSFFDSGTTDPKNTFSDINEDNANTNPVILSADGRVGNVFYSGTARVILTDSADNQIFNIDNVGQSGSGSVFAVWNNAVEYGLDDIVQGSDRLYYRSLINGNIGTDPTSSAVQWEVLNFIRVWNINVTYTTGNIVQDDAGNLYKSLTGVNLGNDPTSSPTEWGSVSGAFPWTKLAETSPTSGSSFQVTGIPATALSVMIVCSGMDYSTSTRLRMQVLDDSVVKTSGYFSTAIFFDNSAVATASTSNSILHIVRINNIDGSSTQSATGTLVRNGATGIWSWDCSGKNDNTATPLQTSWSRANGRTPVIAGTMNGLEFEILSGTFSGGTITVYYSEST